jgi:Fic family protein
VRRDKTGEYETTNAGGELVQAFLPKPLPPDPPLHMTGLQKPLARAHLALGRLDGLSRLLPDASLFLYSYIRKEAVLSSQIEGTQSSIAELMLFEAADAPGIPVDGDVVEVSNYVRAMTLGLHRLREDDFPLSNRLLREIHETLLSRGRGSDKRPGEFRQSQVWIGGSRPGNAHFVPPPPYAVQDCMGDLEQFLHASGDDIPPLIRAGISHVQFETIHPFLDGNGRVGRLLITFMLLESGVLSEPLLYLSLFFKQHRQTYYELLDGVRLNGDWEAWLDFFLQGVAETAEGAESTAQRLLQIFKTNEARIQQEVHAPASALRVHQALKEDPIASIQDVMERTSLSFNAASSGMKILEQVEIAEEVTGQRRYRLFAYQKYIDILSESTEPL